MPQSVLSGVSELKFLKGNYPECLFGSTFTLDPKSFLTGGSELPIFPLLTSLLPSSPTPFLYKTAP